MTERAVQTESISEFAQTWNSETFNFVSSASKKNNTRLAYNYDIAQFKTYLDGEQVDDLRRITPQIVKGHFNSLSIELSPASMLRKASVIRPFLLYMIDKSYPIPRESLKAIPSVSRADILEFRPKK